jgi:hypothetical protein
MDNTRRLMMGASRFNVDTGPTYIEDVFSTYLYTGNGSTQKITNGIDLSGKGGLVWVKCRSNAYDNILGGTEIGINKLLATNDTKAIQTFNSFSSFNNDGFTLGDLLASNGNGTTQSSWTFRKQAKFFDIVTYTGTGSARSVNHNLGSTPGAIIIKRTDAVADWIVYHRSIGTDNFLYLNGTGAAISISKVTAVSTSTFSLPTDSNVNANGGFFVAYLFAHDAGGFGDSGNESVVKCGSFTESGSGVSVNLGWEPQWLLVKKSDGAGSWVIFDNMRGTPVNNYWSALFPDSSNAESGSFVIGSSTATGFGFPSSGGGGWSNGTYIYIAIRRGPMRTPTDATKVFNISITTTTSPSTSYNVGFPADSYFFGFRAGIYGPRFYSRSTGSYYLTSSDTFSETTGGGTASWDQQDNFTLRSSSGFSLVNYFFRRAPGFFDVVAYDNTSSTVYHNLGVIPDLIIAKRRDGTGNWAVLYKTNSSDSRTGLSLNINASAYFGGTNVENPTTTTFNPTKIYDHTGNPTAANGNCIAYLPI